MKVGIFASPVDRVGLDYVIEADRLGAHTAWVPEYWGYDAMTPLAAAAVSTENIRLATSIAQLGARTPAMLAMTALSLQRMSGGRFILGVGTSGPQVIEGWHGIEFSRPIARTRETIEIVRQITTGERLEHDGDVYKVPLPGGQGKALRSAAPPSDIPIYVASLGPKNLHLTGAMANGWIGNSFMCEHADVFFAEIAAGAESNGRRLSDIDLTVSVSCEITDDVDEAARRHASGYAFTFGAMGSSATNFYNNAFARQGFADDVAEVQRLWAAGERDAAAARVPTELGLRTNLIGPPDEIRRRIREYRDCGVNELRISPIGDTFDAQVAGLGQLLDLVNDINHEPNAASTETRQS